MAPSKTAIVLNIEQFIKDIEARPAIWNRNYHCNKYFLEETWQELSKIHKLPAKLLKAKWKGLRDNFRVEFKRIPRNSDGQLAFQPECHQAKWNHFLALQFLVNHMRQRGVNYGGASQPCDDALNGYNEECVVEPDIHDVIVSNFAEGSDDNPDDSETHSVSYKRKQQELSNELKEGGNISVNNNLLSCAAFATESSNTFKKSKQIEKIDETLDLSRNKIPQNCNTSVKDILLTSISRDFNLPLDHNNGNLHTPVEDINSGVNVARHDDDHFYLMSLHPFMKLLTPPKKLKIRTKIQKLILKELYKKSDG
ncbi:uncharacterized protein LOC129613857 [Condylostylus longicornis]|uniref:uncharacterized protein LOC129613857 n=1 Tax=Condylostylus longicornis TaxID=2530218 RepID=UPI00244E548D|nr:uncharacterized protein LOC129613857 [Condylostylus longicornis]